MKQSITVIIVFLLSSQVFGQKIENVEVKLVNSDIVLSFDLQHKESMQEQYEVEIFSSKDRYSKPIAIKEGEDKNLDSFGRKEFVIDGKENFKGYTGPLDFEIKATMTFSPIVVLSPGATKFKKGRLVNVSWRGGVDNEGFNVDLYKGNVRIQRLEENVDLRSFSWAMPTSTKKGKYKLQVESAKNAANSAISNEFKIKSRVPFIVKFLPFAAAGAAAYFLTLPEDEPLDNPVIESNDLPEPPDLP